MASFNEEGAGLPDDKLSNPLETSDTKITDSFAGYDEKQYYMSGPKLGLLIAGLCLALFLLGLDTAIVSTVCIESQ